LRLREEAPILGPLDATLKGLIRSKIIAGTLPGEPPGTVWAGMGSGRPCAACDKMIHGAETEIEIELPGGRPGVRLHRQCFTLWREECDHA
jgi:hypothetical protein